MKTRLLYLILLLSGMTYAQIPTNGLIAQHNFDALNPLQEQTNGDNFIKTGTNAIVVADRFGNNDAYSLNEDYLDRPNVPSTGPDLSLSFWIQTSSTNTVEEVIINDTNTADPSTFATGTNTDTGYLITLKNGVINLKAQAKAESPINPTQFFRIITNNSVLVNDGNWHHVYVYINEVTSIPGLASMSAQINVDGTLTSASGGNNQNPSTFTFTGIHSTGTMTVGNIQGTLPVANRYQGAIDQLLIYDRGLTTAELQTIRTAGNYCFAPNQNILTATVTETTAEIAINGTIGATYDIAYHLASEPFSNSIIVTGLSSNTVATTLTALQASTPYKLYIREQCSVTTAWSLDVDFRTEGVIYINENATGVNDGSSWANAYTSLQTAISTPIIGQEYWIAAGNYKPSVSDRAVKFDFFAANIKVYGGFAGTETQLSDRVFGTNETILSGDLLGDDSGSVDYNNPTKADNSLRVVNVRGNNTLLNGLTITNGFANGGGPNSVGAAICKDIFVRKITIQNCKISNNISTNGANVDMPFNITTGDEVIIDRCKFSNNLGFLGTSIHVNSVASTTSVKVHNSLFVNNRASGFAGSSMWIASVNNSTSVNVDISNNIFVDNIDEGDTINGSNNSNRATVVMFFQASLSSLIGTVSNSIFWNNKARGGVTAKATSGGLEDAGDIDFFNSLDEDDFSNIIASKKSNTSDSDPLFTNAANGDFTLTSTSPAIDTGSNSYVFGATDLLNNQRIFNGTVDMGAYEFGSTTLEIQDFEINNSKIKLYPNPTISTLNIKMNASLKQATIYSFLGREVLITKSTTINTANLTTGMYLIKIEDKTGRITTKHFIKE